MANVADFNAHGGLAGFGTTYLQLSSPCASPAVVPVPAPHFEPASGFRLDQLPNASILECLPFSPSSKSERIIRARSSSTCGIRSKSQRELVPSADATVNSCLRTEIASLRFVHEIALDESRRLVIENEMLGRALREGEAERDGLRRRVAELEAALAEKGGRLAAAEQRADTMRAKGSEAVEALSAQIAALEEELRAAEARAEAVEGELGRVRGMWRTATQAAEESAAEAEREGALRQQAQAESKAKSKALFEKVGQLSVAALENAKLQKRMDEISQLLRQHGIPVPE
eukprot:tig00000692_g3211.t1